MYDSVYIYIIIYMYIYTHVQYDFLSRSFPVSKRSTGCKTCAQTRSLWQHSNTNSCTCPIVPTTLCLQRIWTWKEFGWWEQPRVCINKIIKTQWNKSWNCHKFTCMDFWSCGTFIAHRILLWFQVLHHWFSAKNRWPTASKTCLGSFSKISSLWRISSFQIRFDEKLKVRKQLHCRTGRWTHPGVKIQSPRPLSNSFVAKMRV